MTPHESALARLTTAEEVLRFARHDLARAQAAVDAAFLERSDAEKALREVSFDVWLERDRLARPTPKHGEERVNEESHVRVLYHLGDVTPKGTLRIVAEWRSPARAPITLVSEEIRATRKDYADMKAKWGPP